jgi:hypothetical protein
MPQSLKENSRETMIPEYLLNQLEKSEVSISVFISVILLVYIYSMLMDL